MEEKDLLEEGFKVNMVVVVPLISIFGNAVIAVPEVHNHPANLVIAQMARAVKVAKVVGIVLN